MIAGWRIADPRPGPRPAPELARQERLDREHAGLDDVQQARLAREAIKAEQVLAQCLGRDGQQLSATDMRAAEWSDAAADYTAALQINPRNGTYYLNRAKAYDKLGDADKAKADRAKAKDLGVK